MPARKTAKKAPKAAAKAAKTAGSKAPAKRAAKTASKPTKSSAKAAKPKTAMRELLNAKQVEAAVEKLAMMAVSEFPSAKGLVVLGIRTRGVILGDRIREHLERVYGEEVASGRLDISFYRDDLSRLGTRPTVHGSELPFDITGTAILLVDDVLYTGRTVRAALDELSDFGRPAIVRLVTLVDRGLRELPIQPDYCALRIETEDNEHVHVRFEETDDEECVVLETPV